MGAGDFEAAARTNTVRGSLAFYFLVHNRPMPTHSIPWIKAFHKKALDIGGVGLDTLRTAMLN